MYCAQRGEIGKQTLGRIAHHFLVLIKFEIHRLNSFSSTNIE
jgi:hypothetical protein